MSGWIKFDKEMVDDPRIVHAAATLLVFYRLQRRVEGGPEELSNGDASRFVRSALLGATVTLWSYADTHIRDDDSLPCDAAGVDAIVGIDGFCNAIPDDWVTVRDDGMVELPGYCHKNGLIPKRNKAARGADRQKRYRERQRASRTRDVTHNGNGHGGVTPGGDLDLDLKSKNPSIPSKVEGNGERKTARKRHSPKTAIPDGFSLDTELAAYVTAKIPDANPTAMFEAFCGDARAKGWAYVDWRQAWQTYVRNCAPGSGHWASGQYPKSGAGATRWM